MAFLFQTLGTPTSAAVRQYCNDNKVPQLFVAGTGSVFSDPQHFPWTIGFIPSNLTDAHVFARHILATKPDSKIGVLYQNDATGKDYLIGLQDVLGAEHASMVVKEVSYEVSEPAVNSQIVTLQGSGADVFLIAATTKAAAQAIRKAYDIGWTPLRYLDLASTTIVGVMKPAGVEKSKGVIAATYLKDVSDARWKDDPGVKEWQAFCTKYLTSTDFIDGNAASGFIAAQTMAQVLKQCGDDLSRDNVMKEATSLKALELPLLLPGIKVNTSPTNYSPIRQMQLARFNGESWQLFGDVLAG